jgi:hypothetical protein
MQEDYQLSNAPGTDVERAVYPASRFRMERRISLWRSLPGIGTLFAKVIETFCSVRIRARL